MTKVSNLPELTAALDGSEMLPIVAAGETKRSTMQALADLAVAQLPAGQLVVGESGPADSSFSGLAALKAAPATNKTFHLVAGLAIDGIFFFEAGDFTGLADDENIIKLDDTDIDAGALVRQSAETIQMPLAGTPYLSMLSDIVNGMPIDAKRFIDRAKHESIHAMTNEDDLYPFFGDMMNAFNSGGWLNFSHGRYNFFGSYFYDDLEHGNLRISGDGMGRSILNQTDPGPRNALRIAAGVTLADDFTSLTYLPVSQNVKRGAMGVTLTTPSDAGQFSYGDKAWLRCRQAVSGGNVSEPISELVTILAADAATGIVRFKWPLTKDYTKDTTGTIFAYGLALATGGGMPIENIHIHDLTIRNAGENYVVWLRQMENCIVERVQSFGRSGITSSAGSTHFRLQNCQINIDDEILDNYLYLFALDKGAKSAIIENNIFTSTGIGNIHFHEGVADVIFRNNQILSAPTSPVDHTNNWPTISIAGSSWNIHILDNLIVNSPFSGMRVTNSWKYTDEQHVGLKINGNSLLGEFGRDSNTDEVGDTGILIDSQVTDLECCGNILDFTYPATGKAMKISGLGDKVTIDNNRYNGEISIGVGRGSNNVRIGGTGQSTDQPVWRNYGATTAQGPRLEASEAGQTSPRFYIGNLADNDYSAIYGSPGSMLNFATGAVPGATSGTLAVQINAAGVNMRSAVNLYKDNKKVVGARVTGWAPPTGTASRATFVTSTVTIEQLAQRVKALTDDLTTHGLIGAA